MPGPRTRSAPPRPTITVVHEDPDFFVIDKPAGMPPGGPGQKFTAEHEFARRLARDPKRAPRLRAVNDLDRDASGLLVLCRTPGAWNALREALAPARSNRIYQAVIEAAPSDETQADPASDWRTVRSELRRNRRGAVQSVGAGTPDDFEPDAEPLIGTTHFRTRSAKDGLSFIEIRAETDHRHQIRAHLSERGTPIAGDRVYNASRRDIGRLALHLAEMRFTHPTTGKTLRLRADAPEEFWRATGARRPVIVAPPRPPEPTPAPAPQRGWDHVAEWYGSLLERGGSDHHERTVLPGTLRLLRARANERVLDIACGEGSLCRELDKLDAWCVGVDASEQLIERARSLSPARVRYLVADARELDRLGEAPFDAATCVMALMNIDPLEPIMRGIASRLRPGGRFVGVILHPAFRAPKQTSWDWRSEGAPPMPRQFRRIDAYLSDTCSEIVMNPGAVASGAEPVITETFHRPIHRYIAACAEAGLAIDAMEEWVSERQSEPGPRADEENRARSEIPMFLAFRAVRHPTPNNDT